MVSVADKEEVKFFLDELNENLNYLDEAIIALEENPDDTETLSEIFRVAHTIKGSAGFLGLTNLVNLGHAMENVFAKFQSGSIAVTKNVIDTVLQCKDRIGAIGKLLAQEKDTNEISTDDLIEVIHGFLEASPDEGQTKKKEAAPKQAEEANTLTQNDLRPGSTLIRVWISKDEQAPGIRAFLIQKNLVEVGNVVAQSPSEEEMDDDNFVPPVPFEVRFWIESSEDVEKLENAAMVDLVEKVEAWPEAKLQEYLQSHTQAAPKGGKGVQTRDDIDAGDTVRMPVGTLDTMLNLVGELVIANSGFIQVQDILRDQPEMGDLYKNVRDKTRELVRISSEIQELVMKSRLVPISSVFNRFRRFVRDYSSKTGKKIQFTMTGESTEIDKKIIDEMIKPLTHLVRNSLDHGLESPEERTASGKEELGTLHLEAAQEGNYINVIISDDGRGLSFDKILAKAIANELITEEEAQTLNDEEIKNLIFHSGFSTKDAIDEMSGRGVGMDVVKESVEHLNGTILMDTIQGSGTRITIKLPLTLAILHSLIVKIGEEKFCIPMASIVETQKVSRQNFLTVENNEMVRLRDRLIPVVRLDIIFNDKKTGDKSLSQIPVKEKGKPTDELPVIVVDYHDNPVALVVEQFISRQEMVIKSLSEHYKAIDGISGASILGDGSIILIIDVHGVIQLYRTMRLNTMKELSPDLIKKDSRAKAPLKAPVPPAPPVIPAPAPPPVEQKKPEPKPAAPPEPAPEPADDFNIANATVMSEEEFERLEEYIPPHEPEEGESETQPDTPEPEITLETAEQEPEMAKATQPDSAIDESLDEELPYEDLQPGSHITEEEYNELNKAFTQTDEMLLEQGEAAGEREIKDESDYFIKDILKDIDIDTIEREINDMETVEHSTPLKAMLPDSNTEQESDTMGQAEDIKNGEPEESEFERMKRLLDAGHADEEEAEINEPHMESIALDHFNKSEYNFEKLNSILDGKEQDTLKEWLKMATQRAAEGMESLTGDANISPGKIHAKKYSMSKLSALVDKYRSPEVNILGLTLPVLPIKGMIYFILTLDNATTMASLLYSNAQMPVPDEIDFDPLLEVTNIIGSSYTNTLTQLTDLPIEPGLPEILTDKNELLDAMEDKIKTMTSKVLLIENQFLWGKKEVLAELILMIPDNL